MKATGIVRRIDDLGRVVIPKEIRRTMRIREGDPLEIFTDREGEIILKKYIRALYSALGIYLPLITTNCAVLGVVILNVDEGYNFAQSMFSSIGAGLGFMLAMVMFAGVRERLESCEIPKFMQGLPITLVAASLVSVSFLGFTGIVENIFG